MSKAKILVVDDDPVCTGVLLSLLGEDYEVISANSGSSAISLLDSFSPQLIFLDITMPDVNGYHVLKHLKDEQESTLPVVVISSLTEDSDKDFAKKLGADDYVSKPIMPDAIYKIVAKYLG
ncbi:response regulator [Shewanella sp. Isolate11]|uniref:response regulator n=1 Tax=Shewanella sp. Isolate11 TaxID=2908530 RepID=UPI001EFDA9C9|nr:response regulator [Shewanella sp. Isolate11]MCG9697593.1 response regulator [Shewanella sp. Isolate11]